MIEWLGFGESLWIILKTVFEYVEKDSTFASRSDRDAHWIGQMKISQKLICLERKNITIFATPFWKLRSAKNKQEFEIGRVNFLKIKLGFVEN